jgi:hypothetical protein
MTSSCLDAGTNAFVSSASDLDGLTRIKDGNFDGEPVVDMGAYEFQATTVFIDVKPGSDANPVNLKSKGRTPVALLTTDTFDALDADPASIRFAGTAALHTAHEDIDMDGDIDLLLLFPTRGLQLTVTSTRAYLVGQTFSGEILMGEDAITIVP